MRNFRFLLIPLIFNASVAYAECGSCFMPRVERDRASSLGADKKGFFFDTRFEYQNWETFSANNDDPDHSAGDAEHGEQGHAHGDEHSEHSKAGRAGEHHHETEASSSHSSAEHGGADEHLHNRARDRFYHLTFGANLSEELSLFVHLPYVEKYELKASGSQKSEGLGDTDLMGIWRFIRSENNFLGALAGIKLPTGETGERDKSGVRFEPELQPGSGSIDFTTGLVWEYQVQPLILRGNFLYTFRNEGSQEYQFGDGSSVSVFVDLPVHETDTFSLYAGVDSNFQHGEKHQQDGRDIRASGGDLLFVGPNLTLGLGEKIILSAAVLFPVVQDRGGNHQDLDSIFTTGFRALF